jgi:molybdopterin molybdotransferase
MPTFEQARQLILENVAPLGTESVELLEAVGRVLAEDIAAPWNMPLCDNSAMDGYAVRTSDCQGAAQLRITGYVPAGTLAGAALAPGCAIKIMTGAPIPAGCDTVVPLEDAQERDGYVHVTGPFSGNQHIRFAGEDVRCGEVIIPSGTVIRPPEISALASCGKAAVVVYRRPQAAILSTGDELIGIGEPLAHGKVVDSNGVSLAAAVRECGAIPAILGIARDNHASHIEKMTLGLRADVFVTSAGVSVGERDLVREVLASLGVTQIFYGVDMRPGAPTFFGLKDKTPVFCLPGNPVASMIVFEEFIRPALLKMMGHRRILKPLLRAILQDKVRKKPGKIRFLRVRLESVQGKWLAYSAGEQSTGRLKTMLRANGIALLGADQTVVSPGDEVDVHVISSETGMVEG